MYTIRFFNQLSQNLFEALYINDLIFMAEHNRIVKEMRKRKRRVIRVRDDYCTVDIDMKDITLIVAGEIDNFHLRHQHLMEHEENSGRKNQVGIHP